jgi:hypothetical protein
MGSGFKTFTAGSILTASDVQNYLQDQAVMVFGGTAARSSAIGTANFEEGMLTYLTDVDKLQVYTGASFVDVYPAAATNQGLTLINTTSFSAVAGVEQDFTSADYDFYLVRLKLSASSASAQLNFRYRVANANVTTSTYFYTNITTDTGAGPTRTFGNNVASTVLSTTTGAITQCELTFAKEQSFGRTNGLGSNQEVITAIQNSGVGSPSGVNFFVSSGTMTGKFYAYGYNK